MPRKPIVMKPENKGLTVKLNFWPVDSQPNPLQARRAIAGEITDADTGESKLFNDAGKLLTILGDWNVRKFKKRQMSKSGGAA